MICNRCGRQYTETTDTYPLRVCYECRKMVTIVAFEKTKEEKIKEAEEMIEYLHREILKHEQEIKTEKEMIEFYEKIKEQA